MEDDRAPTILDELKGHPEEAAILGRLVIGYGILELALWGSLAASVGNDDEATRLMFQRMGEKARIDVVEAALRSPFEKAGLGERLTYAIKDLHKCREIRNKYAHTYWDGTGKYLRYAPLEKAAKGSGKIDILLQPLPLDLLMEQEDSFIRCRDTLARLERDFREAISSTHHS